MPASIWTPDLIAIYFPKLSELTDTELQSARNRLESYLRAGWPDEDMRPGSPVGDRVLTPFAHLLVGLETGMGRFMSDLDLEQVSSGTIFNCDFVRAFIANFAVIDRDTLRSTGVVRATFNIDKLYTIDRRTSFKFGDNVFNLRLPFEGHLEILPAGSLPSISNNSLVLSEVGENRFSVDIPVFGTVDAVVAVGDTGTINVDISELISLVAIADFATGAPETSLPLLAKKTRLRFPGAALTSKRNATSYLLNEFSDLVGASAINPGDALMLRASVNPLGIEDTRVDIYARSTQYDFLATQLIRLEFVEAQGEVTVRKFIGKLDLIGHPTVVSKITSAENTAVSFIPGLTADIFARSNSPVKAPFLTSAGTAYEELWVVFDMPTEEGSELLTTITDSEDRRWAYFNVEYRHDPLYWSVAAAVGEPDTKPAGVDILVRPFVPVLLTRFNVNYVKKSGITMKLDQARAEILAYLRAVSYPDGYSDARIGDAMFYAGAVDVKSIDVAGRVVWSAGTKILAHDDTLPDVDLAAAEAAARNPPAVSIDRTSALALDDFVDPELGTADETFAAVGAATQCFIIAPETITFSEQLR